MSSNQSMTTLKVIASGGFRAAYQMIVPECQRVTGITVMTGAGASQGSSPNTIGAQLRRGVPADVVVMSREGIDELIAEGRLVAQSVVDLATTPTAVAIRAGAAAPDISSTDAFKQMLLNAKSVSFPDSTTGFYLVKTLFPRLGIADAMAVKCSNKGAAAVARGEVEIAIRPASELLGVPGLCCVGPLPAELQFISVFSAAIVNGSNAMDAAKQLIDWLALANHSIALRKAGMERPERRQIAPSTSPA